MPPVGAAGVPRLVWDVSELGESLLTVLFPHLAGLRLRRVEDTGDAVVISASGRAGQACCPGCGVPSSRVHGGYARTAADGAPDALQVADRWHLRHNLAESAEKTVTRHRGCPEDQPAGDDAVGKDAPDTARLPQPETPGQTETAQVTPDGSLDACGRERRLVTRTRERYGEIRERLDAGQSLAAICRALDLDRKTVQRFARAARVDELLVNAVNRESKLGRFKPCLCQRWNEGITDAAALHAEPQQRGWAGSVKTVRRYVAPFRQALAAPAPGPAVPKTRQITRWLLTRPDRLRPEEQEQLGQITERCPHIQALAGYVTSFAEMMTGRTGRQDLEACALSPVATLSDTGGHGERAHSRLSAWRTELPYRLVAACRSG